MHPLLTTALAWLALSVLAGVAWARIAYVRRASSPHLDQRLLDHLAEHPDSGAHELCLVLDVRPRQLYPVLSRLVAHGHITAEWAVGVPRRRLYSAAPEPLGSEDCAGPNCRACGANHAPPGEINTGVDREPAPMTEPDHASASRVHYTDPRVRQLAETRWRLTTGGSRQDWLWLGKDNPDALIAEARDWLRAAVAARLLPPPEPDPAFEIHDRVNLPTPRTR